MNGELIKINRDIHMGKGVNIVFNIIHVVDNGPITLLRTSKILAMSHDPSKQWGGICLFENGPCCPRFGGSREKLHQGGKGVNIVFDFVHVVDNGLITLLRTGKILVMSHDPSARWGGIRLFKNGPCCLRCGGSREKLHQGGRYESNNCIEKQLVL